MNNFYTDIYIEDSLNLLRPYLKANRKINTTIEGIPYEDIPNPSKGLQANADYFNNYNSLKRYFDSCHRDNLFRERWDAAAGKLNGKVVVDIGCGPGNLYATLGGKPKLLIGVDVSVEALKFAKVLGYTPLLADAQNLPLKSQFADIVAINATLHHCDDMIQVLRESARLVSPGGLLIVDHDPQLSAWNYKGLAMFLYKIRLSIYKFLIPTLHIERNERLRALSTELHHYPGDGVTAEMFYDTLHSMNFDVALYPHNQAVGAEALQGKRGKPPHWRYRLGQILSGINIYSKESALSIMCVARKR